MNRVYILEPTNFNESLLSKWGVVHYIYPDARPSIWDRCFTDDCIEHLLKSGYDPEQDYIACIGSMVAVNRMIIGLVERGLLRNTLMYHGRECEYRVITHEPNSARVVQTYKRRSPLELPEGKVDQH